MQSCPKSVKIQRFIKNDLDLQGGKNLFFNFTSSQDGIALVSKMLRNVNASIYSCKPGEKARKNRLMSVTPVKSLLILVQFLPMSLRPECTFFNATSLSFWSKRRWMEKISLLESTVMSRLNLKIASCLSCLASNNLKSWKISRGFLAFSYKIRKLNSLRHLGELRFDFFSST